MSLRLTALVLLTAHASGQTLRVGGASMLMFELLYEDPDHFGPDGVVPYAVEHVPLTGDYTEDWLREVDVIWWPSHSLSGEERAAIANWHRQGGTILGLRSTNYFSSMSFLLGFAIRRGDPRDETCAAGYSLGQSPVTDGPFGSAFGAYVPYNYYYRRMDFVLPQEHVAGCPEVGETYLAWVQPGTVNGPNSGGLWLESVHPFSPWVFDPASTSYDPNIEIMGLNLLADIASELPVGQVYCTPAAVNSTGSPARLQAFGSAGIDRNYLTFYVDQLPHGQVGYLMNSMDKAFVWAPAGSSGMLCLGGSIGRHTNAVGFSGASGSFEVALDMTSIPTPNGPHVAQPGDTFHFQAWYRDIGTSNFTPAITVEFY